MYAKEDKTREALGGHKTEGRSLGYGILAPQTYL